MPTEKNTKDLPADTSLRDQFNMVFKNTSVINGNGKATLDRLLNLVEIHRPLAALVVDAQRQLSAKVKSFGLVHYLGTPPSTEKSLAVQTLLREEENDDDDEEEEDVQPRGKEKIRSVAGGGNKKPKFTGRNGRNAR